MYPGPVKMHPRVLAAMGRPAMGHRTPAFRDVNLEIRRLLQGLFQTTGDVTLLTGSGTAGLDAVLSNLFRQQDRVVTLLNGKFGERLAELAGRYATAVPVSCDWGQPPDLDRIAAALEANGGAQGLAFVHNETSVGFTHDAASLVKLAHKHDA